MRQIETVVQSRHFHRVLEKAVNQLVEAPLLAVDIFGLPPGGEKSSLFVGAAPQLAPDLVPGSDRVAGMAQYRETPATVWREPATGSDYRGAQAGIEAIVLAELRPPCRIIDDGIVLSGAYDHADIILQNRRMLEARARNVGRLDLRHHTTHRSVGTGWLVDDDIVVTNRHVAQMFAEIDRGGRPRFRPGAGGQPLEVALDYAEEPASDPAARCAVVAEALYLSAAHEPDFAFLRVQPLDGIEPLALSARPVVDGQPVAAIGYPTTAGERGNPALMTALFGGVGDVKRFAPGVITGQTDGGIVLHADYTTLGRNSGAAVIDLASGDIVGLHFAGVFRQQNALVAADILAAALRRTKSHISMSPDRALGAFHQAIYEHGEKTGRSH